MLCLGLADSSLLTLFMGSDRDRPLTVDADTLTCDAVRSVVSTDDDGDRCADNGTARTHTPWPDIDAVWADPGQPASMWTSATSSTPGSPPAAEHRPGLEPDDADRAAPSPKRVHRGEHVGRAQAQLRALVGDLLADGARSGQLPDDVPADELTDYVLAALSAAAGLPDDAARERLTIVVLTGLRSTH